MKKVLLAGTIALALMAVGCTKSSSVNGPSSSTTTITDDITTTKSYSGTIHITGSILISGNVTFAKKAQVVVDPGVVITVNGSGTLTIAEGVSFSMGTGAYFDIGDGSSGTINANGSDSLPIKFNTSTAGSKWGHGTESNWAGGIWLDTYATSTSSVSYCKIYNATNGIYVDPALKVVISNCTIDSCQFDGIYFDGSSSPTDSNSFVNNVFRGNGNYALRIATSGLTRLSVTDSVAGNGKGGVTVAGNTIGSLGTGTWKKLDFPYIMNGTTVIGGSATITVVPGTKLLFLADAYIDVGESSSATFIANGTPDAPIIFNTNTVGSKWGHGSVENWSGGIWLDGYTTTLTSLQYCQIYNSTSGIYVSDAVTPTISNCIIDSCEFDGIRFDGATAAPKDSLSFINNIFRANGSYGIVMYASSLANLATSDSVKGNGKAGVYVLGYTVSKSGTWKALDTAYIFDGTTVIENSTGVKITIAPGAVLAFNVDAYIDIGESYAGTLTAVGTVDNPITFTNSTDGTYWGHNSSQDWSGGLWFDSYATTQCVFSYCVFNNAASGAYVDANVYFNNCTFSNNEYYGILYENGITQHLNTNTYTNNGVSGTHHL